MEPQMTGRLQCLSEDYSLHMCRTAQIKSSYPQFIMDLVGGAMWESEIADQNF